MAERVISLKKDRVISLTKSGAKDGVKLPFVFTGLSWGRIEKGRKVEKISRDIYKGNFFQRLFGLGEVETVVEEKVICDGRVEDVDLDSSVIMYNDRKEQLDVVYFGKRTSLDGSIYHFGDDTTGSNKKGKLDNEVIKINLRKVDRRCKYLVVILNSFSHHLFDEIPYVSMRIYSNSTEDESDLSEVLAKYQIDNNPDFRGKEALVLGVFYRSDDHWDFKASGIITKEKGIEEMVRSSAKKALEGI